MALVQTGYIHGTANRTPGWTLHKGKGARSWSYSVVFPEPFTSPPKIFLAFRLIDAVNKEGVDFRLACESRFVTDASFTVTTSTWSDSKVWSLQVTWIAVDARVSTLPGTMIQLGTERFHKTDHGYKLDAGNGERSLSRVKAFDSRFTDVPVVLVGYSMLDLVNEKGGEIALSADVVSVQKGHVELSAKVYQATKQWSASISWIAIDPSLLAPRQGANLAIYASRIKSSVHIPGFSLHNGEGARYNDKHVAFEPPFNNPPSVATFLSSFTLLLSPDPRNMQRNGPQNGEEDDDDESNSPPDHDSDTALDLRIISSDERRTTHGFDLRLSTWNDSRVWDAQSSWLAVGIPNVRNLIVPRRFYGDDRDHESDPDEDGEEEEEEDYLPPRLVPAPKRQLSIPIIVPKDEEEEEGAPRPKAIVGPPATKKQKLEEPKKPKADEEEKEEEKEKEKLHATNAPAGDAKKVAPAIVEDDEDKECKICMDEPYNTVLIPCGHMAICFTCAQKILSKGNKECPICKRQVEQIVKTFKA